MKTTVRETPSAHSGASKLSNPHQIHSKDIIINVVFLEWIQISFSRSSKLFSVWGLNAPVSDCELELAS